MKSLLINLEKEFPLPRGIEISGKSIKNIILYFKCIKTNKEYIITTNYWKEWLKLIYCMLKCNLLNHISIVDGSLFEEKSKIITNTTKIAGIELIPEIYNIFNENNNNELFDEFIVMPFITDEEKVSLYSFIYSYFYSFYYYFRL